MNAYVDIRITPPIVHTLADLKRIFGEGLLSIDMNPPASGPEIELTFSESALNEQEATTAVERSLGCTVLASRTRPI